MKTVFDVKFRDGNPMAPNMGRRGVPGTAIEVQHHDGTVLYINPCTYNTGVEMLLLNSKFNSGNKDSKYIAWAYTEHILDFTEPEMFMLLMSDFSEWHKIICGTK